MRWTNLAILAVGVVGCGPKGQTKPCEWASSDIEIDKAGDNNSVESAGTLMCVSPKEHVYVLWIDDRSGTPAIWFNASKDKGVTWKNSAIRVNQFEGSGITKPAIACSDDAVYVAWEDDRDGELKNHNIYFQKSVDDGDSWLTDDVPIDNDPDGRSFSQGAFIATANSNVYIAWFDDTNGPYDIFMAASTDEGATWGLPVRVDSDDPGNAFSASPQVAARTDQSTVYVTWEDARDGANDIYFNKSENAGASFGIDARLDGGDDPGSHNSFAPKIAADGQNVYVVWHDGRNAADEEGPRDIYANYSLDGGNNWSAAATLVEDTDQNAPGFFNSRFPVLAVKANQAIVAWEDNRNVGYDIYARQLKDGQPTGKETRLDGGNTDHPSDLGQANSLSAHLAASSSNVVVAWLDDRSVANPDDGFDDLYYNFSTDFGATWNAEDLRVDNVEAGASFKLDFNLALLGTTMYAAWTDGRAGTSDIYQHTMEMGDSADYVIVGDQDCDASQPPGSETSTQ